MNPRPASSKTTLKAGVYFIAWFVLQVALYLPSTLNRAPSERLLFFGMLAGICIVSSVLVAVLDAYEGGSGSHDDSDPDEGRG